MIYCGHKLLHIASTRPKGGPMGKKIQLPEYLWKDRKHWMWFPFSFTKYAVTEDRLYITRGFFSKIYDESLLYRITDLTLRRSFWQRIFGTGTVTLTVRVDRDSTIELKNIKKSVQTRMLLSRLVEEARKGRNVVGKEFYDLGMSDIHLDMDSDGPDFDGSDAN